MNNKPYRYYTVPQLNSMKELVEYNAQNHGDEIAISYASGEKKINISYKQFKSDVDALGMYFVSLGFHNTHIAVVGGNSYEWILTYFAVVNYGNVIVPIDRLLNEDDISETLERSNSTVVVHSKKFKKAIKDGVLCIPMDSIDECIKKGNEIIASGKLKSPELDLNKMCTIIYTSGTTSKPKGVMLSHKNIMSDGVEACKLTRVYGTNVVMLPLHHTFAFTACIIAPMIWGKEAFINKSLKSLLPDIQISKPYLFVAVPMVIDFLYKKIWDNIRESHKEKQVAFLISLNKRLMKMGIDIRHILFKKIRDGFGGNLECIISGGAPIDEEYMKGLTDIGFTFLIGYGITECSPIVALNRNKYQRIGSAGLSIPACDIKTEFGEILVRGSNVMLGYYNDEESTKKAFTEDGWFKTGDLGHIDSDGFLYITGRLKNLIILANGKNVSPEELENKVSTIPNVLENVVFEKDGKICVEIFAENKDGIESAIKVLNRDLPMYKKIQEVVFREEEFKKTTTKKIIRNAY